MPQAPQDVQITAIKPQQKHEDRVSIFVDKKFRMGLSADLAREHALQVGSEWSESLEEKLRRRDLTWKAKNAALHYLAARPRSRQELRTKLKRKEFPEDAIDYAIGEMDRLGYLDDRAFAEMFVRDRIRLRPRGKRRLSQELRQKGIASEVIDQVIASTFEAQEVSETEMAREAVESWLRKQTPPGDYDERRKLERRLYGHLARRGFSGDSARGAMDYARQRWAE